MNRTSVIVPAFNREEMLVRALASVFRQSRPPDEVVVVDDASTDDLSEAKRFAESEGAVWVQLDENKGPAFARNRGAAEVAGDWICFLDSDDVWEETKLERQLEWHEHHPEVPISQVEEGWIRNGVGVNKPKHWEQKSGDLFAESVERCSIGPSCVMMSRQRWEAAGGFDPRFRVCEDYELWLRVCSSGIVGLVNGGPLVQKHAGHKDQLSVCTPAMDRFRVVALLEHFLSRGFTAAHRDLMAKGIESKSAILSAGAQKRGAHERAAFYSELAGGAFITSNDKGVENLIFRAWRHATDQSSSKIRFSP
ncbi:MAG: glycosyltransferase family A protein [Verrucomicrobiales bacterium]|nr:glycosyltransferase family A protein [Verrucomicrobiales bacterium]